MNELNPAKRAALKRLLAMGASVRAIASAVGCTKNTVMRYSKMWTFDVTCGCGKKAGHNGWCSVRFDYSPVRRGWLAQRWRKRSTSALAQTVDKATAAAKALGHDLGPFVWGPAEAASMAFAMCKTCGKQVRIFGGDSQWERYQEWERFAGNAVNVRCRTAAERAAEDAAHKERREWRNAKRTLLEVKRTLRELSH